MVDSLSRQADEFEKIAPLMVGQETLFQKAVRPGPKFRVHVVDKNKDKNPPPVEWQEKRIVSVYGFAVLGGSMHEIRQVVSMDGHAVQEEKKAQETIARAITAKNDDRKKQLLEDFQKHGLNGAVTDFGQLILLFTSKDIPHFEFGFRREEMQGAGRLLVFSYQQIDGPDALTVVDGAKGEARQARIQGEVWVRSDTYGLVRMSFASHQGDGDAAVVEEATVDYAPTSDGVLMPSSTDHRELRGGQVIAENKFSYSDFHKFSVTTDLKFPK